MNDFFRRRSVVGDQRGTDRCADRLQMSPDPNFAVQARDKAQPNRVSGVSINIVGKHGELIAAEPCQEITRPSGRPKTFGNHLQDPIPQRVAVEIVDALEIVEVYQKECMLAAIKGDEAVAAVKPLSIARRFASPVNDFCNARARSSRI